MTVGTRNEKGHCESSALITIVVLKKFESVNAFDQSYLRTATRTESILTLFSMLCYHRACVFLNTFLQSVGTTVANVDAVSVACMTDCDMSTFLIGVIPESIKTRSR